MRRALWKKSVAEAWWLLAACALGLLMFSWFRVWIVGELDTTRFKQIVDRSGHITR